MEHPSHPAPTPSAASPSSRGPVVAVLLVLGGLALLVVPLGGFLLAGAGAVVGLHAARHGDRQAFWGSACLLGAVVGLPAAAVLAVLSVSGDPVSGDPAVSGQRPDLVLASRVVGWTALGALVAGLVLLTAAWARASGQQRGAWTAGAGAVVLVLAAATVWVTWGMGFDLADAGRSTAHLDAVMVPAAWTALAALVVTVAAGAVTAVRSSRTRPAAPGAPPSATLGS
ncbi:hypothetical protein [Quadrisphaera sp. DSM 44207]|uniref:hypothetical protein n=1 Tax=Quadrisphaera sp. DSM 44207 TaxID=1881057 RepID=UPI0008905AEA|nr:hypothetical protein [Quadrisphaera sp. DSM 44207]SDQ21995.1 hypothetical protein SAMN05428996_1143 [Quadrisphaera sp. DSM 44207]